MNSQSSNTGTTILTNYRWLSFVSLSLSVFTNTRCLCSVAEEMGKPGSDAGMPGIEDSEVGKIDDAQFGNANWPKLVLFLYSE